MATNGNFVPQAPPAEPAADADSSANVSKDEVGWYFVEQYYTTLSKTPDRIHLFYNKRSQFVSGIEAEVANVSVGRPAIQDRIKELDFQDTKVRVSNVDSQASSDGIVIQVIGEISNHAAEPKKFVQTFVLAQQPTGYFVLNDIMRYINEEENTEATDIVADETEEAAPEEAVAAEPVAEEPAAPAEAATESGPVDIAAVEQKLEHAQAAPSVNGDDASVSAEGDKPAIAVENVDPETTARELAEEDAKVAEKPADPTPTPLAEKAAPPLEAAAPPQPTGPPKPMTWASRAAAAAGPRPVVPLPKTATPPAQSSSRAPAPAAAAAAPAASPKGAESTPQTSAPAASAPAADAAPKEASGWQMAGADSKRQNRPQSISANPAQDGTLGYVKYVNDKVQDADLRKALEAHGDLTYFDINRQKNCAFVEYKTAEALAAALSANPHVVSGEQIVVEQRRPKAGPFGGNFPGGRGGSQRGRGGFDGNRNGSQGGRGGFSGQNRGRGGARGRGNAQTTAA